MGASKDMLRRASGKDFTSSSRAAVRSWYARLPVVRLGVFAEARPDSGVTHSMLARMQLLQGTRLSPITSALGQL
jgi:hypothetical protein